MSIDLDRRTVIAGVAAVAVASVVPSATAAAAAPVAGGAALTAEQALINDLLAALYDAELIISCGPTFYGQVTNIPAFYGNHQQMIRQARAFGINRISTGRKRSSRMTPAAGRLNRCRNVWRRGWFARNGNGKAARDAGGLAKGR
jgi:hypothetical protein